MNKSKEIDTIKIKQAIMKTLSFLMLLFFTFGFTATKNSDSLNGIWIPVKQEIGGTALPPASFEKQKLVISDSAYTFTAESVDKGVVKYASDNKMDIYGKDGVNAGKHFTAIYKYKNEQLSICYNLKGDSYPESFDTKGKPMFFLCVFKKEPAK